MPSTPSVRARAPLSACGLGAMILLSGLGAQACAQAAPVAQGEVRAAGDAAVHPDSVRARAERGRIKGEEDAPVTIIEISDFQCPFCRTWALETWPRIDSAYVQTGRVRLLFINYPLPHHAQSFSAHKAATCAGAQGRFWEMHDRIFEAQREWSGQADAPDRFNGYAAELGLDMDEYRDCTVHDRTASLIAGDVMQAAGAGIQGTPSFILNGQRMLSGAIPFEEFSREIEGLLEDGGAVEDGPGNRQ